MGKVSGSYDSVTRGVSEQVMADRLPGQSSEMVNMVDSPVRGKSRRHGSVTLDEKRLPGLGDLSAVQREYARGYREYSFFLEGVEHSIIYMSRSREETDTLPFCFVLNKATGQFLDVVYGDTTDLEPWLFGGVSAITTVGQYVIMASNILGAGYSEIDQRSGTSQYAVAEVKVGAYSRTYTLKVERADTGEVLTVSYTTLASSYPELLDTSDIVFEGNPNYQKQVNDKVNEYNSAVNAWLGEAAASITPQNIAQKLVDGLADQGFTDAVRIGGTIALSNTKAISANDSGDGTAFRGVADELDDPAKLSAVHKPGKVVLIRPKNAAEPYYMVAHADTGGSNDFQTVVWKEGAAQIIAPGQVFALGSVSADGSTFYLGSSPGELSTLLGKDVPGYASSVCGDKDAIGAIPYFFGRRITLLTVFMDRLVIVANGTIFMSRVGDYFNWFRQSKLTVKDDDPIEMYALGAEDDVISRSVTYAKDLFMFGQRKQYVVSGRALLSPKTAGVTVTGNETDADMAQPVVVGNLLYYGKFEDAKNQGGTSPYTGRINQFQLGLFQDTPETYCVSQQLARYIRGIPIEMAAIASPGALVVRTDGYDFGLYLYFFLDQPGTQTRAWDSWSRWEWVEPVGRIIGVASYESHVLVYTLRHDGADTWVACEQFALDGGTAVRPYLDMQRSATEFMANTGTLRSDNVPFIPSGCVALADTSPYAWLGGDTGEFDTLWGLWDAQERAAAFVGAPFESRVEFTPPFVRDRNEKAVVNGRLTVSRYLLSVAETGGFDAYLHSPQGRKHILTFNGRMVGHSGNLVGYQPVHNATLSVPAGRSNTEHTIEITSRLWLPLAITSLEWAGQWFLNSRRV